MDNTEKKSQIDEFSKNSSLDEVEIFEGEDIEYAGKLPPGWIFCPTDEELIIYYLQKRVENQKLPCENVINEVHLYESDITDIIEGHKSSEQEGKWYFFTNRERKYPGGDRPGRSTPNGFWRAAVADTKISMKNQETGKDENIGLKKTLNFFWGKQNGENWKSEWMMHEYRTKDFQIPKENGTKLDEAVLCKVYCNGNGKFKVSSEKGSTSSVDPQSLNQSQATSDSAKSLQPNQNCYPNSVQDVTNQAQSLSQDPSYMQPTPTHLDPHSVCVPYNQDNDSTFYPQFHYDSHNLHFAYDSGGSSIQGNSTYYNMAQYQPHATDSFFDQHQPNWNTPESGQLSFHNYPTEPIPLNYIDACQSSIIDNGMMPPQDDVVQTSDGGAQQFYVSSIQGNSTYYNMTQYQPHATDSFFGPHQPDWNTSESGQFPFHNYPTEPIPLNYTDAFQSSVIDNGMMPPLDDVVQTSDGGAQQFYVSSIQSNSTYYNMTQYQSHATGSFSNPHQPDWNTSESFHNYPTEPIPLNYTDAFQSSVIDNGMMPPQDDVVQTSNGGAQQFYVSSLGNMMDTSHDIPDNNSRFFN